MQKSLLNRIITSTVVPFLFMSISARGDLLNFPIETSVQCKDFGVLDLSSLIKFPNSIDFSLGFANCNVTIGGGLDTCTDKMVKKENEIFNILNRKIEIGNNGCGFDTNDEENGNLLNERFDYATLSNTVSALSYEAKKIDTETESIYFAGGKDTAETWKIIMENSGWAGVNVSAETSLYAGGANENELSEDCSKIENSADALSCAFSENTKKQNEIGDAKFKAIEKEFSVKLLLVEEISSPQEGVPFPTESMAKEIPISHKEDFENISIKKIFNSSLYKGRFLAIMKQRQSVNKIASGLMGNVSAAPYDDKTAAEAEDIEIEGVFP